MQPVQVGTNTIPIEIGGSPKEDYTFAASFLLPNHNGLPVPQDIYYPYKAKFTLLPGARAIQISYPDQKNKEDKDYITVMAKVKKVDDDTNKLNLTIDWSGKPVIVSVYVKV